MRVGPTKVVVWAETLVAGALRQTSAATPRSRASRRGMASVDLRCGSRMCSDYTANGGVSGRLYTLLEPVEDPAAILAVFDRSGLDVSLGRGRKPHEAAQAHPPLHGDHHPGKSASHPFVGLEQPLVDLLGQALPGLHQLVHALERKPQLLFLSGPLGVLGLTDHEVQVLERHEGQELAIHRRAVPRSGSGSWRSPAPRESSGAPAPDGRLSRSGRASGGRWDPCPWAGPRSGRRGGPGSRRGLRTRRPSRSGPGAPPVRPPWWIGRAGWRSPCRRRCCRGPPADAGSRARAPPGGRSGVWPGAPPSLRARRISSYFSARE